MTQTTFIRNMFTSNTLEFEDKIINNELIPVNIPDSRFGILNLTAIQSGHNILPHEFIFMVDRSSSMEDECGDGKTKMQHICHILKNMVEYFNENQSINAHITICTFDDLVYTVLERTKVTDTNFNQIIRTIDNIRPRGSTDIELALTHIISCCSAIRTDFPTHNICSIFMTDGQISKGASDIDTLSSLIDRTIDNSFIGVGIDHDGALLTTLGTGKNCNYYFIDKLENSGFVYGEIIHGVMYKILTNVHITIENGLIYDFQNNDWVSSIEIGNIVGDSNKTYHITTHNPTLCYAIVSGNSLDGTIMETLTILKTDDYAELDKYIYRQRTLQHLYTITELNKRHNSDKNYDIFDLVYRTASDNQSIINEQKIIRTTLENFMKEMKIYMTANKLNDDSFMKNLCDDIYICYRTFTTKYATMYAAARQTSQGTQRCYTVNYTPQDDDTTQPPRLVRQTNRFPRPHMLTRTNSENNGITHVVAGFDDTQSPYRTPSSVTIMRAISGTTQKPDFDEEYDQDTSQTM